MLTGPARQVNTDGLRILRNIHEGCEGGGSAHTAHEASLFSPATPAPLATQHQVRGYVPPNSESNDLCLRRPGAALTGPADAAVGSAFGSRLSPARQADIKRPLPGEIPPLRSLQTAEGGRAQGAGRPTERPFVRPWRSRLWLLSGASGRAEPVAVRIAIPQNLANT
jgi:hypothetical protein